MRAGLDCTNLLYFCSVFFFKSYVKSAQEKDLLHPQQLLPRAAAFVLHTPSLWKMCHPNWPHRQTYTPSAQMPALFIFCWTGKQFKCHWLWWRWWQNQCAPVAGTLLQASCQSNMLNLRINLEKRQDVTFIRRNKRKGVHFWTLSNVLKH